ncbi:hypothetical protein PQO01_00100 [Lentisphaera marina]|uniref:hypothetical protein n=1 Tax=Lentisphaera marina TaxID=1111041 RepID=UPI0023672CC9|nr:hypothetical protein [Lentisphaera marina]MDD7983353.1 hypothetical protein [Lentisphaera marina]
MKSQNHKKTGASTELMISEGNKNFIVNQGEFSPNSNKYAGNKAQNIGKICGGKF